MSLKNDFNRIDASKVLNETDITKKTALMQYLAQQSRLDVFDVIHGAQTGHWGGASSLAELLTVLYFHLLKVDVYNPSSPDRDRLILSKGHASCMLYTTLAKRGFLVDLLPSFRKMKSKLQGHPCMLKLDSVDMSTGSLGHGLSVGLGMSLAAKLQNKDYYTVVIVGEGCLNEGQTWEAIMAAAKFKSQKLVLLVDHNQVQLDGTSKEIMPLDPLVDKFKSFNWNVAPIIYDGHDVKQIIDSWQWIESQPDWPVVSIYATHKGKGVSFMEDQSKWHGAPIDEDSYQKGRPQLLKTLEELEVLL